MIITRYSAVLVAALTWLVGCTPSRYGDSEAALVLEDLTAIGFTSRLRSLTPAPKRKPVTYFSQDRQYQADLYQLPGIAPTAGILMLPGIAAAGKDDRRLTALARTLARVGFAVLVPDIPGFRSYRVSASDIRNIVDAYANLRARSETLRQRSGIFAISFAVGPAVLAALHPEIREQVRFVVGIGGYYDLERVVTFVTTGYFRGSEAKTWEQLSPSLFGKALLTMSNAQLLPSASDRDLLTAHAWAMFQHQNEDSPVDPVLRLQPGGQALLALVNNGDPQRTPALISALPPRIQAQMSALNPAARDLSLLSARLYLLHGRGDNVIPYTESLALAAAVPPQRAQLHLVDGLAHVNLRPQGEDLPSLLSIIEAILSERR